VKTPRPDVSGDQAARIWADLRELTARYPSKEHIRAVLDLGRGSGRFRSLIRLWRGPASLSALAEAIGVDAPYATIIVDSLEERGLVERHPDPDDRRRKLVALTAKGEETTARAMRIEWEPPPGFAGLSPEELDILEDLVRRISIGTG
jgi:DNA-binding MarR family transcriptional regulator